MQIATGIWREESANQMVYLLDCGGCYALVDVGEARVLPEKLRQIADDGIDLDRIAAVFLTHNHGDHVGALADLRLRLSAQVVAHRLAVASLAQCTANPPISRQHVDHTVDDGDKVEVGEMVLEAHHLPGHTPDSTAWQVGDHLFVGDIIFCDGGIGWMDIHWGSCVADYRESLVRLRSFEGCAIYPGHRQWGVLSHKTIEQAERNLTALAEADGSPVGWIEQPAPRRESEDSARVIRIARDAR
jgi:glyoxylase-like metal-dependent hydrolase (beta-lactamase superfamily II)